MGLRGPKPRGEFDGKSEVVSTRLTEACKAAIRASAKQTGRSLSQEIEALIWAGLAADGKVATSASIAAEMLRRIADDIDRL